jgi:hypothetical protein
MLWRTFSSFTAQSISNALTGLDAGKLVKTSVNHNAATRSLLFLSASKFAAG